LLRDAVWRYSKDERKTMPVLERQHAGSPSLRALPEPREVWIREAAFWLLCAFWFTIPWEGVIRFGGTTTIAKAAGAAAFAAGLVAVLLTRVRYRPDEFVVLTVVFACLVAVSRFWTLSPSWTSSRTITMAQLALMVLLTWEFGHTRARLMALMAAFVAGCGVVGGIVVFAFLDGQQATRYTAPGTHPGDLSFVLTLGIPIAWYLSLRTSRTILIAAYRLFVPFAVLGVTLTGSRAVFISLPVVLLLIPMTMRYTGVRTRAAAALTVAGVALSLAALSSALSGPLSRLSTTSAEIKSGTLDHRTQLWAIAFRLIGQHPLLGIGAGSSRVAVGGQFTQERGLQDTFFSIGAELGLVGLALFLMICLAAMWRSMRQTPWLERRFAVALGIVYLIGQVPRHADYVKNTWAILALLALMGTVMRVDKTVASVNPGMQTWPAAAGGP
jgi:O-antigen ligase